MVEAITDFGQALKLKNEWGVLYEQCPYTTPFQSFAFFESSWRFERKEDLNLCIIVVRKDNTNQLVAIMPTCINTKGVLTFIGQVYSDFCSALVLPECDNYSLYESISNFIKGYSLIRSICLGNLQCNNPLIGSLKPFFDYYSISEASFYSTIDLFKGQKDLDYVDALRSLAPRKKKKLRHAYNKCEDYCFKILNNKLNDKYPLEDIDSLVKSMIDRGSRTKEYFSDSFRNLWKDLYDRNLLLIALLSTVDGVQTINFMFYCGSNNEYIKWLILYKDSKWNMILNLKLMDVLYNQGGATVNFARGIYDYKLVNFHPNVKPLFQITICKNKKKYKRKVIGEILDRCKQFVKLSIKS